METGKNCASCGFLARRPYSSRQASTFFEMPSRARKNGGGWWIMQIAGSGIPSVPACCVGAYPILDEIKSLEPEALNWRHKSLDEIPKEELNTYKDDRFDSTTPERNEAAKVVFNKLRPECPKWFPYTPGLSPEKHLQEFRMQQLEQRREEFEQRMERERKEFELKLDERNREERKRTDRIMIWLTVAAIVFAAMQVYAALATINPNSWLFNWLR